MKKTDGKYIVEKQNYEEKPLFLKKIKDEKSDQNIFFFEKQKTKINIHEKHDLVRSSIAQHRLVHLSDSSSGFKSVVHTVIPLMF